MMKSKLLIVVAFLLAAGAILFFNTRQQEPKASPETLPGSASPAAAPGQPKAPPVEISFLYSTEKKDWVESSVAAFASAHPEIKVTLVGKGSLEAAEGILEGSLKPVVWSPADSLALQLFAGDWLTKNGQAAFGDGDEGPEPLLLSPLVFVAWADRAEVLAAPNNGVISWRTIHDAVTSNRGWPAVKGKAEWGFVKLGHTDPTRSNSGLQALILIALDFFHKKSGKELRVEDVLKRDFQKFLREIESGVTRFERSTGTFMTDMVRFGPSKYDIAVAYESLAASQLANAQGRWGNLKVFYPSPTLWSDHPAAVLRAPWVGEREHEAGRLLLSHLRGKLWQERALEFGFRPADPAVPLKAASAESPFTRLAAFGLRTDIPPVAEPPDPAVIRNLLALWTRTRQAQ
jgi:hypothetical protein